MLLKYTLYILSVGKIKTFPLILKKNSLDNFNLIKGLLIDLMDKMGGKERILCVYGEIEYFDVLMGKLAILKFLMDM